MRACDDLTFLNVYWTEAKRIAHDIKTNLPCGAGEGLLPVWANGGAKMFIVKYSDLKNSWSPKDLIYDVIGKSSKLEVLADKIEYMIYKGRANDVKPMIEKICTGRIKKLTKHNCAHGRGEFLGYGSFRWNHQAYTLNQGEINHLKQYFNIK